MNILQFPNRLESNEDMQIISARVESRTARIETPDGTLYATILEDEHGKPFELRHLGIGKPGSNLRAYLFAIESLVNLLFAKGCNLYEIVSVLSNISSDKLAYSNQVPITSGPDGLVQALLIYAQAAENAAYESGIVTTRRSFIGRREA